MKTLNTCLNLAKITIFGIIFLGLVTCSSSCNKEDEDIPHKDIFRCEIDGVSWEAGCESNNIAWGCIAIDCQYYEDTGGFEITASNKISNDGGFSLYKSPISGGIKKGGNDLKIGTFGDRINNIQYQIDTVYPGYLFVEDIDEIKKNIEGNFSFKAFSISGDSVVITNGYFKVKYRP